MIKIRHLSVNLPGFSLSDINLGICENKFFALLGPTGSGKTVLLEAIAGLIRVSGGSIIINGRDVTALPAEKRGTCIMYQDCCLFPHLSVEKNITYGLSYHDFDVDESIKHFNLLVDELNIGHILKRKPRALSGGEIKRVALARALITRPRILLLDEPFSAIDPAFRSELQQLLKRLQQSSGVTFLMVTHNFAEALSLADSAAILQNGRVQQQGSMMDIFKKPCSAFVADFVGMKNVYPSQFDGSRAMVNGISVQMGEEPGSDHGYIAIRPEDIVLSKARLDSSIRNSFKGTVRSILDRGITFEVHVMVGDTAFRALVTRGALIELHLHEGEEIYMSFKGTAVHCF